MVSDWPVVAAALATVLLSATLLSAGPIYGEAITISAFARAMENAPAEESGASISASPRAEDFEGADLLVDAAVDVAMGGTDGRVTAIARATTRQIASHGGETDLAEVWHVEGIDELATLAEGRWPADDGPTEIAVPVAVARTLGIDVGDTLVLAARNGSETYEAAVVGMFTFDDVDDVAWFNDVMVVEGAITSAGNTVHGPLIASRAAVVGQLGSTDLRVTWRVAPDFNTLEVEDISRFSDAMTRIADTLNGRKGGAPGIGNADVINFSTHTRIGERLDTIDRSLTVTSSTILAVVLQLSLLALYALVLTARLVVDTRTTETALARSRGASPTQVAVPAFFEGVLLAIPAILVGPPLAARLVALLGRFGPLSAIGLTIDPSPNRASYLLAAAAAGVAILTLLWPAFRAARAFPDQQKKTRRTSGRSASQKLGIDLALVALLAIAIWQLGELGPRVSATVRGRLGVDPLLVIAPALGLATGVVLALRIIPRLARLAERLVSARVPVVSALALWQVARRPDRYSRSALLLMTAVALGVFASSFSVSWTTSQHDQAAHQVGADAKFLVRRSADALPDFHLRSTLEDSPGISTALPVLQQRGPVTRGVQGRFVVTDAASLATVVRPRPDIAGDLEGLAERMDEGRVSLPAIVLPGEPAALEMVWEVIELQDPDSEEPPEHCPAEPGPFPNCLHGTVFLVIEDGSGLLHRLEAGVVYGGHDPVTLRVDLVDEDGRSPVYPLKLTAVEFTTRAGRFTLQGPRTVTSSVSLHSVEAVGPDGSRDLVVLRSTEAGIATAFTANSELYTRASARFEAGDGLTLVLDSGVAYRRYTNTPSYVTVAVTPGVSSPAASYPVIATDAFLDNDLLEVGMRLNLRPLGVGGAVGEVIGTIPSFPGVDPNPPLVLLIDLPSYQAMKYVPGQTIEGPEEMWLAVSNPNEAIAAVAQPPILGGRIVDRLSVAEDLMADPIAVGTVGAFTVGFVSAAVFAVIGFTISALVSARDREVEFSLLHALGLKRGQLGLWLLLEQAALVAIALLLGLAVGIGIGEFLLPLVTLNQDGSKAVPDLLVIHDWASIWGFQLALLVALGVVLGTLIVLVARRGVASSLRFGDEP